MKKTLITVISLFLMISTFAQRGFIPIENSRLALVIGNANYQNGSFLKNPINDARAMKTTLEKLGFKVLKYENLTQNQMKQHIDEFGKKMHDYDVALFYYAGHGIQTEGLNYLVPVDATLLTERQVEYECVRADRMFATIAGEKTHIAIFDACRNNPFERAWGRSTSGSGLAFMQAPSNSFIAHSTAPGKTASDGIGKNGLYTQVLVEEILVPNLTINEVFQNVRAKVEAKSLVKLKEKQTPWESTSLNSNFYFVIDKTKSSGKSKNNTKPLALFTVNPPKGTLETLFKFNASNSIDNETKTSDLEIRWDFDGDGNWDTDFSKNKIASRKFERVGIFLSKVEVKDAENNSDINTYKIITHEGSDGIIPCGNHSKILPNKRLFEILTSYSSDATQRQVISDYCKKELSDKDFEAIIQSISGIDRDAIKEEALAAVLPIMPANNYLMASFFKQVNKIDRDAIQSSVLSKIAKKDLNKCAIILYLKSVKHVQRDGVKEDALGYIIPQLDKNDKELMDEFYKQLNKISSDNIRSSLLKKVNQ